MVMIMIMIIIIIMIMIRWREERRKRYPTQTNIQKKEEAEKTVEDAGGLLYDLKELNLLACYC